MSGLFLTPSMPAPPTPPPAPSVDSAAVQQAAQDEIRRRSNAQGRASTFLTNPQTQRTAQKNEQKYLGGS